MKRAMKLMMGVLAVMGSWTAIGQTKIDEKRMEQDIEVAENILSTLVRQQFGKRNFFPMEVTGAYMAGYGVTFRMPQGGPFNIFVLKSFDEPKMGYGNSADGSFSYSIGVDAQEERDAEEDGQRMKHREDQVRIKKQVTPRAKVNVDSLSATADKRFLEVCKNFLADYGDVLSQLKPDERIVISNRSEEFDRAFGFRWPGGGESRRSLVSVEAKREDINQLKQGKINREQFIGKLKIIDTEFTDDLSPDLEVLSSMFNRLYREDLSKTYFSQGEVTYERLKDFGVIYYMHVYSSNEEDNNLFYMPTLGIKDVTKTDRDKKVKELYPKFENDLKENLLEYGRTLRSLKPEEQLMFNVKMTRCEGCGIPETLEVSVKDAVLQDFGSGKLSKEAALAKVNVKKIGVQ